MAATKPELIENRRSELTAAFLAFGSVSEQLSGAFESLRGQVAQLQSELGEARAGKQHLAARLSVLIKGLPGGVLVLDSLGRIQEYNPAAVQLLGEPLLGQLFTAVLARAAVNARSVGEHAELRSGRFVNVSRRDLKDGGDVVLLTDVTETHLMQVFLTRQQRLLTMGELAAGLAHQIRTPLAAALLYASQMTLGPLNSADLSRCAEKTVGSLKQLDQLVNDMLAFAHGGAAREAVSVSALLEQVAESGTTGAPHFFRQSANRRERRWSRRARAYPRAHLRAFFYHSSERHRHRACHRQVRGRSAWRQRLPGRFELRCKVRHRTTGRGDLAIHEQG
jgi:two-component system sensor histidine kinase FlrB